MLDKLVSQGTCNLKTFLDPLALKAQETHRKKSSNRTLCKHLPILLKSGKHNHAVPI